MNELQNYIAPVGQIWNFRLITLGEADISLGNIILALVFLWIATKLSRLVTHAVNERMIIPFVPNKNSQTIYRTLIFYFLLIAFITVALQMAGIPLTAFAFISGALAIGVGFGSQNIVNNFISGIILMVEKPIRVGDIVQLETLSGRVLAIGTRSTKLRTVEGKINIIPNSYFLEKNVMNWSFDTPW